MRWIQREIGSTQSMSASESACNDDVQDQSQDEAADDRAPERIKRILHSRSPDDRSREPAPVVILGPKAARLQATSGCPAWQADPWSRCAPRRFPWRAAG